MSKGTQKKDLGSRGSKSFTLANESTYQINGKLAFFIHRTFFVVQPVSGGHLVERITTCAMKTQSSHLSADETVQP